MQTDHRFEGFAITKYPVHGRCKNSPFANGWHRCGTVPEYSMLDGGMAGDSCMVFCFHCEKKFEQRWFVLRNQPNQLEATACG